MRAEEVEEAAEILNVRLGGGVVDHRLAARERRRHHGVFRRRHARLVEEDALALQPVGTQLEAALDRDPGAELLERVDVRVEPAPADCVAARRVEHRVPEAGEQRPAEQERGPDAVGELLVGVGLRDGGRLDADVVVADPLDVGAEIGEQRDHRVDVADARHVAEDDRLVGQQARRQDRQCAVLVPGNADPSAERVAPLDHEGFHGCLAGDGGRQGGRYGTHRLGSHPRTGLGDAHGVHEERGAAAPRARRGGVDRVLHARKLGEDEAKWRVTALLHDFDYEIHPTLDQHPQDGAPILRELGYPDEIVEAVLSHAEHLAIPRDTPLKKTLFACDELSGFVHACGLCAAVRPRRPRAEVGAQEAEAAVVRGLGR